MPEVGMLMQQKFAQVGGKPQPGSDLDQSGLSNGLEVVKDYMSHNELGLALEHLCYMIEETSLPLSEKAYTSIVAAGRLMQIGILRNIAMPPGAVAL